MKDVFFHSRFEKFFFIVVEIILKLRSSRSESFGFLFYYFFGKFRLGPGVTARWRSSPHIRTERARYVTALPADRDQHSRISSPLPWFSLHRANPAQHPARGVRIDWFHDAPSTACVYPLPTVYFCNTFIYSFLHIHISNSLVISSSNFMENVKPCKISISGH